MGCSIPLRRLTARWYWLDEHLDRLLDGCATLRITVPWPRESLVHWTHRLIARNGTPTARLRLTITRGCGEVPIYASPACRPNLVIIGTPLDLPEARVYEQGVRLKTTELARVCPRVKSLNFLPSVLAYFEAHETGFDDALFVGRDRHVREGATFNVAAIRGGTIVTPADEILMGVTRAQVIDLARASGYTVEERLLPLDEAVRRGRSVPHRDDQAHHPDPQRGRPRHRRRATRDGHQRPARPVPPPVSSDHATSHQSRERSVEPAPASRFTSSADGSRHRSRLRKSGCGSCTSCCRSSPRITSRTGGV